MDEFNVNDVITLHQLHLTSRGEKKVCLFCYLGYIFASDPRVGRYNYHRLSEIQQRLQKIEIGKYFVIYRFFSQIFNELYFRLIFYTYLNRKIIVNFFIIKELLEDIN